MNLRSSWVLLLPLALVGCITIPEMGRLVTPEQCDVALSARQPQDFPAGSIVLQLTGQEATDLAAANKIEQAGWIVDYWIEIARCPELADAHPEWMASLQGHDEWRRHFAAAPAAAEGELVKNYPWVPIAYAESFAAQLGRVRRMLAHLPAPRRIFLNDLQGAPSACGCGNVHCRWTTDYGPAHTATPLGPDAAARFVVEVQKLAPQSQIIPVWTTECAQADPACAGVACYGGKCWQAWTEQLMPLERVAPLIAVLLQQDDLATPDLTSFDTEPPRHGGHSIARARLIPVLIGGQDPNFVLEPSGVIFGSVVQSWEPRLVRIAHDH